MTTNHTDSTTKTQAGEGETLFPDNSLRWSMFEQDGKFVIPIWAGSSFPDDDNMAIVVEKSRNQFILRIAGNLRNGSCNSFFFPAFMVDDLLFILNERNPDPIQVHTSIISFPESGSIIFSHTSKDLESFEVPPSWVPVFLDLLKLKAIPHLKAKGS